MESWRTAELVPYIMDGCVHNINIKACVRYA